MYTISERFCAKKYHAGEDWSLAGWFVEHKFLLVAVRFCLLGVGWWWSCSEHFAAASVGFLF